MKIKTDSKPVYGDDEKYTETKRKTYDDRFITNFHSKKIPKEKAPCKCLSIIMLDSVIITKKKYYPQTLLEKWKYEQKNKKIDKLIDDDLEKVNLIVILLMKQNLIFIVMNLTNNLFKVF